MSEDSLTFRIEGELTIDKLSDAFVRFSRVLDALGESHDANVRWVLAGLDYGSAAATAQAVPLDSDAKRRIPAICDDYIRAARQVAGGDSDPAHPYLRLVRELTEVADENNRITFETTADKVVFIAPASIPADEVQGETTRSLGTVRGRVETLSHRSSLRFSLYELATDRAVLCHFDPDLEDKMRTVWGHIADVSGTVTRDAATGRPLNIRNVTQVEVLDEGDPVGYLQARGAFHSREPAELALRRIRNAS